MSNVTESNTPANANRLLWAGFVAILASGVGFAIRGGILDNWGAEFGFTATELGNISGRASALASSSAESSPTRSGTVNWSSRRSCFTSSLLL
jgi:hypothetical protein